MHETAVRAWSDQSGRGDGFRGSMGRHWRGVGGGGWARGAVVAVGRRSDGLRGGMGRRMSLSFSRCGGR